ncbi:1-phosphofructokinase family hexose kinase [Microbacterium sp.]|uniref:1-phosphofructokinase family hexose kinase n=1 Tax=Microbacterium sp. TaxID=51671 RepID=UPI003F9C5369
MIITATPSPSVDWTISLDKFTFGAVNRAHEHHREPSGKGINVSVALTRHGYLTRAIVAGTGDAATYIAEALAGEDVPLTPTPGGPVRTNITLLAAGRPDTKINTDNSALSEAMITALEAEVAGACSPSITFLSAGSLPPGTDPDAHARLVVAARAAGAFTVVDSSGIALQHAVAAGPDLIKPNLQELSELTGDIPTTISDVIASAERVRAQGVGSVLVSMGADGALLIDEGAPVWARSTPRQVRNTVGAGDALLAGFLAECADRRTALTTAVRWGASAVEHTTTLFRAASEHEIPVVIDTEPDLRASVTV